MVEIMLGHKFLLNLDSKKLILNMPGQTPISS